MSIDLIWTPTRPAYSKKGSASASFWNGKWNNPIVGLIDLCSTYSVTGVSMEQLQEIVGVSKQDLQPRTPRVRRSWTHLGDNARSAVVTRYGTGESSTALAAEYGVAKSTILGILRTNNVVVRRQPLELAVVAEATRLYKSGLSLSQVAQQLDINQETMRMAILRAGVRLRPPAGSDYSG